MSKLIPDPQVAKRYGVHLRTLSRWDETAGLGFPPPIYVRKRKYRDEEKLDDWDRRNSREAAATAAAKAGRKHAIENSTEAST
jgi:hypothetical protein